LVNKTIEYWTEYIELTGKELGGEYADFEIVAIQVLDGEFDNFEEGVLEKAFRDFLAQKAKELGVSDES